VVATDYIASVREFSLLALVRGGIHPLLNVS
jgi:hypothetical protein